MGSVKRTSLSAEKFQGTCRAEGAGDESGRAQHSWLRRGGRTTAWRVPAECRDCVFERECFGETIHVSKSHASIILEPLWLVSAVRIYICCASCVNDLLQVISVWKGSCLAVEDSLHVSSTHLRRGTRACVCGKTFSSILIIFYGTCHCKFYSWHSRSVH